MPRSCLVLAVFCLALSGLSATPAAQKKPAPGKLPPAADKKIDFTRDIQPLLAKHCLRCHGAKRPQGGLRLDDRAAALRGGDSGPSILPGKSADSLLVKLAAAVNPDDVMPPEGPRMSAAEVSLLRAWIDQGVPWAAGDAKGGDKPKR